MPTTFLKCLIDIFQRIWQLVLTLQGSQFYENILLLKTSYRVFTKQCHDTKNCGLVTFAEEILNGKLHFLCSVCLFSTFSELYEVFQTFQIFLIKDLWETASLENKFPFLSAYISTFDLVKCQDVLTSRPMDKKRKVST